MKKTLVSLMVVILLGGCFSTPVGFRIQEPGGYNFTTGNQRDVHSFERYANGQVAVKITLRLLEIPGSVYEPAFDWAWFLDRIGHPDSTLLDEPIIHAIDDGILIQQVQGLHSGVNPVSGDFSTGAAGLMISKGSVGAPVREFTIASTLQRMLRDVVAVGHDHTHLPMNATGVSLAVADVTVSGR